MLQEQNSVESTENLRTGVILAAGMGTRLAGVSDQTRLKPLTVVGGEPLIKRTIRSLYIAGCQRIVIVLGYSFQEMKLSIMDVASDFSNITFVYNDRYQLSNGLSLLAAKDDVDETFVLTMADHILSNEMMLLAAGHNPPEKGATLLVDYNIDDIFNLSDATKVRVEEGRVVTIGKEITGYNAIDTGVFVCTRSLIDVIAEMYRNKGDASLSEGVQALAQNGMMHTLDIGDAYWQDVDTPEMLEHAETMLKKESFKQ